MQGWIAAWGGKSVVPRVCAPLQGRAGGVSCGSKDVGPTHWHSRAQLNEISLLPPGAIAWFEGAKVTRTYEPPAATSVHRSPAAAVPDRPTPAPAAGEVIYGGERIFRPAIGQVTAVGGVPRRFRFSDAEIRARTALAAETGDPDAIEREIIAMKRLEAVAG